MIPPGSLEPASDARLVVSSSEISGCEPSKEPDATDPPADAVVAPSRKKAPTYAPATKAPAAAIGVLGRVRRALFADDRTRPIVALLEDEKLSTSELRELRHLIDRKIKEAKVK